MNFEVAPLPYSKDALAPAMSPETLEYHYEKHHKGYMTALAGLLKDKPEAGQSLVEVIKASSGPVFNNAAQVWNHTFYWNSMKPKGGGEPTGLSASNIQSTWGDFAKTVAIFVRKIRIDEFTRSFSGHFRNPPS